MVFLINSNKEYYQVAAPVLIKSLIASGVDKRNIVVVVGGCDTTMKMTIDGIEHNMVNHDSFDMTAFIHVIENDVDFDSFFFLHDTTEVGKTFYKDVVQLLEKHKPIKCMRLKATSSMSMGWYDVKSVKQHKDRILEFKNLDLSNKGLQKAKHMGVDEEDLVFTLIGGKINSFTTRAPIITKMTELYGQPTERRCEFYDEINLKKYKRHWARAQHYSVSLYK